MEEVKDKYKGYKCQCCGLFVKAYIRHVNANMAIAAILLYQVREKGFVHVEDLIKRKGFKRCGDFSYLKHYGLIEAFNGKRHDGSNRNGHYKITGRGIMFVEGSLQIKEKFIIFNNVCEGFEGEEITIQQALGKKFDFNELMGNGMTLTPKPIKKIIKSTEQQSIF